MAPTLCALLCFMGLCWCRLTWAQEGESFPPMPAAAPACSALRAVPGAAGGNGRSGSGQMGSFWAGDVGRPGMGGPSRALGCRSLPDASRRPSLTAEPGLVIPRGQPVSFRCQGPPGTKLYRLKEELRQQFMDLPAAEGRGLFSVETAPNTAGNYSCQYKIQTVWSEPSNTLQLVVTGLYEPPSLSALPGPNVTAGQNVTLRCQAELWFSSAALAKDGETVGFGSALHTGPGSRTDFLLAAVSDAQQGTYRCYSFHGAASAEWSSPSAPVELRLTETFSESKERTLDAAALDYTVGNLVRLILAGLVLVLLGILLIEHWQSSRRHKQQFREPCLSSLSRPAPEVAVKEDHVSTLSPAFGTTMAPTLCALLCFMGLCWCRLTWAQEGESFPPMPAAAPACSALRAVPGAAGGNGRSGSGQMGSFWAGDVGRPGMGGPSRALGCRSLPDASRRPSLTAEPGLVIPRGQPVSFRCQGPPGPELYRLKKEGAEQFMDLPEAEGGGLFSLETAPNTAGNYSCQYKIQTVWSEPSNTLQLVVTGLYEPPSLSALPGPNVTAGQNVTLRCQAELWFSSAALAKDGETVGFGSALHTGPGSRTDFLLAAVSDAQQGTYRCYSFHRAASAEWSSPSAPVELRLTERTNADPGRDLQSGFTSLKVGILVGVSAFLVLTFLFLSLRRWCPSRLGKGGRDTEVKTARRPDPARTTQGETMFAAVSDDRQAEEARQEDTALQREGPQEVTYAQLDHKSLKRGAEPPPPSGPVEPSVYAVLPPVSSA
ncbi:leukocyte immunoglobulin-like receptor subfamily B member 1 [Monodelphis domestica]|uniref:leukocyte immunoglobulin-like receptor subfamily B member 1 n=1 Tax=Monodelphis domestica TaxID=13616 RepID=UPI0024E1A742|nr:leukocyte immunoglobulin-like receptor subfamily B member 1 [Monodelphis domestica]